MGFDRRRRRDRFSRMHLGDLLHYIGTRERGWVDDLRRIAEQKARELDEQDQFPRSAA